MFSYPLLVVYPLGPKNHLFQENKFGSLNVKSLVTIKKERLLNTIYQMGLNGIDKELKNNISNYQLKGNSLWIKDLKKIGFTFIKQIEINMERFRLIGCQMMSKIY